MTALPSLSRHFLSGELFGFMPYNPSLTNGIPNHALMTSSKSEE